ncbi:MAG: PAS domain-containing protein [Anaerolineales bacterium]|nr:PAS domain-containing protein [Anaerolineales bacterium]
MHSTPVTVNEQTVLFSIIHDVTDRKRMESALHESEAQLRDVFNTNLDGLIVVDRSGIVRLGNPAAAKLLKRPIKQLVGQRFGLPTDLKRINRNRSYPAQR